MIHFFAVQLKITKRLQPSSNHMHVNHFAYERVSALHKIGHNKKPSAIVLKMNIKQKIKYIQALSMCQVAKTQVALCGYSYGPLWYAKSMISFYYAGT